MEMNTLLRELIALSMRKRHELSPEIKKMYSRDAWFKEFSTITLGAPRRTGKTTAIKECSRMFDRNLILVPYAGQKELYPEFANVYTPNGLVQSRGIPRFSVAWVDSADYVDIEVAKAKYRFNLYDYLTDNAWIIRMI